MFSQRKLDFTPQPTIEGKKDKNITVTVSESFLHIFDQIVKIYKTDRAKLGQFFILEGMKNALGNAFMSEPFLDDKLRDLMTKQ